MTFWDWADGHPGGFALLVVAAWAFGMAYLAKRQAP